ncbi:hypothetical protein [Christiangramia sp.]|uniref:hypothetical protein n=1 Tax=Christiangramia sp. TaxID=1931228 RepID=UPI002632C8B3|nr:hypothetical protein [Christiangramia sp.]
MGVYRCSDGSKVTQSQIDRRVRQAKAKKLQHCLDKYGYIFCQDCKRNDCKPVDCSHDVSVKECKESGKTELAWDVDNITLRGRSCHARKDKNDVQWNSNLN